MRFGFAMSGWTGESSVGEGEVSFAGWVEGGVEDEEGGGVGGLVEERGSEDLEGLIRGLEGGGGGFDLFEELFGRS